MLARYSNLSKSIAAGAAGAVIGAVTAPGTAAVVVPPDVTMPWWGYILVGLVNIVAMAALSALPVYLAPANTPPTDPA